MQSSFQHSTSNKTDDDDLLSGTQLQTGKNHRNESNGRAMWLQDSGLLQHPGDGNAFRRNLADQAQLQQVAGLEGLSNIAASSASLFNQSQAHLTSGLQSSGISLSGLASGLHGQFSQDALRSLQQQLPDHYANNGLPPLSDSIGTAPWMAQSARMLNLDPSGLAFNNAQSGSASHDADNPLKHAEQAFLASLRGEGPSAHLHGQGYSDFATNLQLLGQQRQQLDGSALTAGLHQDDASNVFSAQNFAALGNVPSHHFPAETAAQKLLQQEYADSNALQSLQHSRAASAMPQVLRSLHNLGGNNDVANLRSNLNMMSNTGSAGREALLAALQQDRKLDLGLGGGFQLPSMAMNQSLLSAKDNQGANAGAASRNISTQEAALNGTSNSLNLLNGRAGNGFQGNSGYAGSSGLNASLTTNATSGGGDAGEVSLFLNGRNVLIEPNCHDVLLGRGNFTNKHEGNVKFRGLVAERKAYYNSLTGKEEKMKIARKLIDHIASLDPPGRFLMQDDKTMLWYEADMGKAIAKNRQALREGFRSANRKKAPPTDTED